MMSGTAAGRLADCGLESEPSYLVVGVGCQWGPSWGCWLEHVVSVCDLGFLTTWQLDSKDKHLDRGREPGRATLPFMTYPQKLWGMPRLLTEKVIKVSVS